ncbi:PQQ-dependent sugar dehydrogenase [Agrobacterium sp.]|jgi:glucose/arabinose dehydrogenase|uniref:PQQ-dependent sugar dehydrogenase n=1 Tax=Agrobacterium sp. TaxID=361 RepID=UPI0028A6930C|nr:PQQ-dependent sugar dehydrogenase [Agrobacterium sp.]
MTDARHRSCAISNKSPVRLSRLTAFLASAVFLFPALAQSDEEVRQEKTERADINVQVLASGLENPWSVEALPDGAYIVTERAGRMRIVKDSKLSAPLGGLPAISAGGQGGLLDIALDPQFDSNRTLYFTASITGDGGRGTAVFRAQLAEDGSRLEGTERIFAMNKFTGTGQHFGSRLAISTDGKLFFGIGDRGNGERAQDPDDHAGSILRIEKDGKIPSDNPYGAGGEGATEIWSIGHRNPQGLAFDSKDGTLFTVEHGARGGDEINIPQPKGNFGWPVISYGKHYSGQDFPGGTSQDGMIQPEYYWDPSIAPGAIAVYRGSMFPEWDGNLFVTALKYQLLVRLERDDSGKITSEERMLKGEYGRMRDVVVAPDGALLILTDESDGALLRVSRANAS